MKLCVLVALAVVGAALAAPAPEPAAAAEAPHVFAILKSEFDQQPDGPYNYAFETENGISRQEAGELRAVKDEEGHEQNVVVVRGSYSYADADGVKHTVNYVADETGYHVDIPKPESRRR